MASICYYFLRLKWPIYVLVDFSKKKKKDINIYKLTHQSIDRTKQEDLAPKKKMLVDFNKKYIYILVDTSKYIQNKTRRFSPQKKKC